MRKIFKLCVCGLATAALVTGCAPAKGETAAEATASAASEESTAETTGEVDLSTVDNGTITLGKYKGVEVAVESVSVTDEEIEAEIQAMLDANPDYEEITDRGAAEGDIVNIDYVGLRDGEAFEGGTNRGFDFVIGETSFIPGFKEGLLGAKTGEELSLDLTFPDPYPQSPDLAGQPAVFKVTVNSVKTEKPAVLNDALVQRISDFKNVDEYKEQVRQMLLEEKQAEAEGQKQSDILAAVIAGSEISPNQAAVDANYNNYVAGYTEQATSYGMDFATLASIYGMDEEGFRNQLKLMAETAVQQRLVFRAIAEAEHIEITDEDRENLAEEMSYESAKAMVDRVGQFTVDDYLLSTKVMDFLSENAVEK